MRRFFVLMREDGPGEKVLNSRSFSMILPALRRGEPLLNSPAALMTSRFRQRCFRAAGCSPHPPSCACSEHEKLAAHSKPFSPGPSIPPPHTGPLIITPFPRLPFPIKKTGTVLRKARFFRSSKKTAVRLFLSRGRDQPERVRHVPYKLL